MGINVKDLYRKFREKAAELEQLDPHAGIVPKGSICVRSRDTADGGKAFRLLENGAQEGILDIVTFKHAARLLIGWGYASHDLATADEAKLRMHQLAEYKARVDRERQIKLGVQEYFTEKIRETASQLAGKDADEVVEPKPRKGRSAKQSGRDEVEEVVEAGAAS